MLAQNTQPPESGAGLDWQHAACAACRSNVCLTVKQCIRQPTPEVSLAQLAEHALRKRMVMGSIPIRGFLLRESDNSCVRVWGIVKIYTHCKLKE